MTLSGLGRQALIATAVNGFIIVAFGAFGAHALEQMISSDMLETFNTGIRYHMFHVSGLLAVALLAAIGKITRGLRVCFWLFLSGILLFSGSLYLLAVTGIRALGMITPLGGLAFLAAWLMLGKEAVAAHHD